MLTVRLTGSPGLHSSPTPLRAQRRESGAQATSSVSTVSMTRTGEADSPPPPVSAHSDLKADGPLFCSGNHSAQLGDDGLESSLT